ncbi:hypothetical protein Tco_1194716 [Tanacetum coccineum]
MRRKRVNEDAEANAPPKVPRKDHGSGPTHSTRGGKSLAIMGLDAGSTFSPPAAQSTPTAVSDSKPLSYAKPQPHPVQDIAQLLKKATAKIARRDQKIQEREEEIKKLDKEIRSLRTMETEVHGLRNRTQNLETLLEAEVDMKKAAEAKSVSTLQAQVTGKERIKAAFEEFKKSENEKVKQQCADMDARLDALSINFDEELYPHMLTAIAGRRWGMSEGLKYGVEHGEAKLDLAAIEAYDPEAEAKYVAALTALRDLKYPLVDQLEKLRDAPKDLLMTSLHLESDFGEDAPEWISELHFSTSQLKIPIYPEVRDLRDPWVGSAHHARSDGILVSTPTVAPQGLAILLADAAVQTEASKDEASPRLLRSKSLPPMYNLDWP